ncbi:hypothetical protein BDK51DRAFT_29470 [Blyttiomyces helicus]|uniref:Uncharacterized protein n=1 Tax=Blyttiomyces helicus TaxID=388810 RepID=A0A4P9W619_9FUNG|nr:hypothetical protein BDK51DRAFT_29470 [Blyttiomyces helicus]|eukprot:RKO86785.1 hypothetical protein BDK51DRAFT_29470 [Blyttiomyces helicus]
MVYTSLREGVAPSTPDLKQSEQNGTIEVRVHRVLESKKHRRKGFHSVGSQTLLDEKKIKAALLSHTTRLQTPRELCHVTLPVKSVGIVTRYTYVHELMERAASKAQEIVPLPAALSPSNPSSKHAPLPVNALPVTPRFNKTAPIPTVQGISCFILVDANPLDEHASRSLTHFHWDPDRVQVGNVPYTSCVRLNIDGEKISECVSNPNYKYEIKGRTVGHSQHQPFVFASVSGSHSSSDPEQSEHCGTIEVQIHRIVVIGTHGTGVFSSIGS